MNFSTFKRLRLIGGAALSEHCTLMNRSNTNDFRGVVAVQLLAAYCAFSPGTAEQGRYSRHGRLQQAYCCFSDNCAIHKNIV